MAKKIQQGTCVYCTKECEVTEDHVIPQCLFPNGLPIDVPKVFACQPCNHIIKSGNDTYLRDFLVTDMNSSQSPLTQELFSKFERAVKRNQSKLANDAMQNQLVELRTKSGLFGGLAYTSQEANERIPSILLMMVRGLYNNYRGKILPQDISFDARRVGDFKKLSVDTGILIDAGAQYMRPGDGSVFDGLVAESPTRPYNAIWILNFYRRVVFLAFTESQSKEQGEEETATATPQAN